MSNDPNGSKLNDPFLFSELFIYAVQVITFALVAWVVSAFFTNETYLARHVGEKINDLSVRELISTLAVILILLGVLWVLSEKTGIEFFEKIMPAVYEEFPRTVYLFGSSVGGPLLASGFYLMISPAGKSTEFRLGVSSVILSLIFVVVFFLVGYALRSKPKA